MDNLDKGCIACGGEMGFWQEVEGVKMYKCEVCGLVKTEGRKGGSSSDYHRDKDYRKFEAEFRNIFRKRFDLVSRFAKGAGKVLEVGSATGVLLAIFKESGWEAWGIEPSGSAEVAKERGLKIIKARMEEAKLPKNYFDVVIINHTLEHLEDPVAVLKKVKGTLRPGGIVYVDVPNFGSLSAVIWGRRWKYLLPEEHRYHFTSQSLRKVLEKAGFRVKYERTWSGVFDVANPWLKFYQDVVGLRWNFVTDLAGIGGNVVATLLNRGTSLAMIGES